MNIGNVNLFLKMIKEEYALTESELSTLTTRMLADDKEFEKVWRFYKNKNKSYAGGVDAFKQLLQELIN